MSVVRPFNTYGPRQSARAVIPTIISQIASGKKKIHLGDVSPTRDFTYVADTCKGFIEIATCDEAVGKTINLGSNSEISILDTFNIIKSMMKSNVTLVKDESRLRPVKSEVYRLWCDNSLINQLTGFKPSFTIEEGLKLTVEWFSKIENLRRFKSGIYNV